MDIECLTLASRADPMHMRRVIVVVIFLCKIYSAEAHDAQPASARISNPLWHALIRITYALDNTCM